MLEGAFQPIRRYFRLPKDDRLMFYTLIASQIEAGFVAARACRSLEELDGLAPGVREVAKAGAQAEREGLSTITGLGRSGLLPEDEVAALRVAEINNVLPEALLNLVKRDDKGSGLFAKAIGPNLYYMAIVVVLVLFAVNAVSFFDTMGLDGEGNPLFEFSLTLNAWLPLAAPALFISVTVVAWGMHRWTSPLRRILGPFDQIGRLQYGVKFCDIAEMLAANGAQGQSILEHVRDLFHGTRYLSWNAQHALTRLVTDGARLEDALGEGLLLYRHASLLAGLVPGGAVDKYETGYRTIATLQRQMLQRQYRAIDRWMKIVLLTSMVFILMKMGDGMYELFSALQTY